MIDYKIISTGSKGNCVIIHKNVMVDCGVPFGKIKNDLYDVKYLLITHTHQDHLNRKTIQQIATNFPRIKIIGNYEVHSIWNCNIIANAGFTIETDDFSFYPFECVHDVLCYGYTWNFEGKEILYATDTSTLENAPAQPYDVMFLESNHDEQKLEAVRNENKGSYNPYLSGKRHLSTQQAKTFFYLNRRNQDSQFIELHQSARFY
jgi:L-ascorbate metabolism protein UlaG (beta-lactamase superfamily)